MSFELVRRYVPHGAIDRRGGIDVLGSLLLIATATPLLVALSLGGASRAWGSATVLALFAVSVLLGAVLMIHERHASNPVVPLALLRQRVIGLTSLGSALVGFAAATLLLGPATPAATVIAVSILIGLGLGPLMSLFIVVAQAAAPRTQLGTVTSANQFARQMAGTIGVAVAGAIIAAHLQVGLATLPGVADLGPDTRALVTSPNALTDPARLAAVKAALSSDLAPAAVDGVIGAARAALSSGLSASFAMSGVLALVALAVTMQLPRVTLPDTHEPET